MALTFELLEENHARSDFNCGEEALNFYLSRFARQDVRRELARTFVIRKKENCKIIGYYTLCSGSVGVESLPENLLKSLPRYPVPIVRLARLAVDKKEQSKGYGELLLMDALFRASVAGENMGIYGMLIDAKNEKAKQFYQKYGFQSLLLGPLLRFAPLKELKNKFLS